MKIYMAGPVFTTAERLFNQELTRRLRDTGHEIWLPQEHDSDDKTILFRSCIEGILWSEVVLACVDGPDPDSGTAAECGFAYQKRPIVAYRTDFRAGGDGGDYDFNLVLGGMATTVVAFFGGMATFLSDRDPIVGLSQAIGESLDLAEVKNFASAEADFIQWAVAPNADRAIEIVVAGEGVFHFEDIPLLEEGRLVVDNESERLYRVVLSAYSVDPVTLRRKS